MIITAIRKSPWTKRMAAIIAISIVGEYTGAVRLFALTSGPSQPEYSKFQPIGANDMVDLFSGDLKYNIPLLDVGGYPINLVYEGGVGMDQEASWVGLGWNLNVGAINRMMKGVPDDFNGQDEIIQQTYRKPHTIIKISPKATKQEKNGDEKKSLGTMTFLKLKWKLSLDFDLDFDNYKGFGIDYDLGVGWDTSGKKSSSGATKADFNFQYSSQSGTSFSPGLDFQPKEAKKDAWYKSLIKDLTISPSITFNSNEGLVDAGFTSGKSWERDMKEKLPREVSTKYSLFRPQPIPTVNPDYINRTQNFALSLGRTFTVLNRNKFIIRVNRSVTRIKSDHNYRVLHPFGIFYMGSSLDDPNAIEDVDEEAKNFDRHSVMLSTTSYTPDVYSVSGHGVGGSFTPELNSMGMAKNIEYESKGLDKVGGISANLEFGKGATGFKLGIELGAVINSEKSGTWGLAKGSGAADYYYRYNRLAKHLAHDFHKAEDNAYEPWYFKNMGEFLDVRSNIYTAVDGVDLVSPKLFLTPTFNFGIDNKIGTQTISTGIKNDRRIRRTVMTYATATQAAQFGVRQTIENYTRLESSGTSYVATAITAPTSIARYGSGNYRKPHHMSELKVLNEGGSTYVYGIPVYNTINKEVNFNVEDTGGNYDVEKNLVSYSLADNSKINKKGIDNYYSSKETKAYATSFLLTEVLSPDYVDNDGVQGPSDGDIGNYVKFNYHKEDDAFKWRSPYGSATRQAFLNRGVRTDKYDDKGHYNYGEKELWYLQSVVTKTHVALFFVSKRWDARGVIDEDGGIPTDTTAQLQYKLDRIELYAKNDFVTNGTGAKPIKIIHFEYAYDLCQYVPNFTPDRGDGPTHPLYYLDHTKYGHKTFEKKGKLALYKVWFTYGDLQYPTTAPYVFEYSDQNPDYNAKAVDMWGNYKPSDYHRVGSDLEKSLNNNDYPYVPQDDRTNVDHWAQVYMISKIHLPSGGTISLEYESDDYAYVQDKQAMQMLKIEAFDDWWRWELLRLGSPHPGNVGWRLHSGLTGNCKDLIVVKKPDGYTSADDLLKDEPVIYFNCFVDLNGKGKYEPIQGFFEVTEVAQAPSYSGFSSDYLYLKIKPIVNNKLSPVDVHPISKFAWQFTNANAQQLLFASYDLRKTADLSGMAAVKKYAGMVLNFIPQTVKMIEGEANYMIQTGAGTHVDLARSFIRVYNQNRKKVGGGYRVKKVEITDNWDIFTTDVSGGITTIKEPKATYTQEYTYTDVENGTTISSGVATFEPSTSMENGLRMPMALKSNSGIKNLLSGSNSNIFQTTGGYLRPINVSYELGPVGETFFPTPSIGYSKVTVKSTSPSGVTAHATGRTVNEFYTAKDFPVKAQADRIDVKKFNLLPVSTKQAAKLVKKIFGSAVSVGIDVSYKKELFAASQGFLIETNDMHGKPKAVWNYDEFGSDPMTGVVYKYKLNDPTDPHSGLNSDVTVIHTDGTVEANVPMGVDVDFVINPTWHRTMGNDIGLDFNLNKTGGPEAPPVVTFSPKYHLTNRESRKVTFTKIVRRSGILETVEAIDHGAKLNTVNLAYDAITGELLLSKVQNEFGDYKYSFTKPAHWVYSGMAGAWKNINLTVKLTTNSSGIATDASGLLQPGDELIPLNESDYSIGKVWILDRVSNKVSLIDKDGNSKASLTDKVFLLVRSGHRNMPATPIENITSLTDMFTYNSATPPAPIDILGPYDKVLNASAAQFFDTTRLYYNEPICFHAICDTTSDTFPPSGAGSAPPPFAFAKNKTASSTLSEVYWTADCHENGTHCYCVNGCSNPYKPGDNVNPYYVGILGIWRPYRSFVYYGRQNTDFARNRDMSSSDPNSTNIRTNGYIEDFVSFWNYQSSPAAWEPPSFSSYSPWTWNQTLSMADNLGNELQSKDALNIYSSAFFGYNKLLATHVAGNADYREMLFDGFEDYLVGANLNVHCGGTSAILSPNDAWTSSFCSTFRHWPLWKGLFSLSGADPIMSISGDESHTGWQSIKLLAGTRDIILTPELSTVSISAPSSGNPYSVFTLNKSNFVEGYTPKAEKDYVISYWVLEPTVGDFALDLYDASGTAITTTEVSKTVFVDGWKRVELKFRVSSGQEKIKLEFTNSNGSNNPVYFDDLRIFPYKSNMKSFVYDRLNLRLMATLDENNYATFYEYDKEGNLVRKKVETERGIMTASESRSALKR